MVLVDTGVLFAAAVVRDRSHERAVDVLQRIRGDDPSTTDHVLVETWSLINARYGWTEAMRFWRAFRTTPIRVETVIAIDLERAQAIADGWADQEFDIVDCTAFAAMERLGCRRAATFDTDFAVYRYGPDRQQAFEILT